MDTLGHSTTKLQCCSTTVLQCYSATVLHCWYRNINTNLFTISIPGLSKLNFCKTSETSDSKKEEKEEEERER